MQDLCCCVSSGLRSAGIGCLLSVATAWPLAADQPVTGPLVPGFEAYDRAVPVLLEKWQIPGAAVAIALDGRIVYARGFGFADRDARRPVQPDTRFRLCSVSKTLTAAVALKLVEDGLLSLSDRAFPTLDYPTPTHAGAERDPRLDTITVHHLLSHTAGWLASQAEVPGTNGVKGFDPVFAQREIAQFLGIASPPSAEMLVRGMVGQPLQAAPGAAYEYSNIGYLTLGRLVELKTGLNFEEAVRRMLRGVGVSGLRVGGSRRSELAGDEAVYYDYPGAPLATSHLEDGLVPQPYQWSLPAWDASGAWVMSAIEAVRFLLALEGTGDRPGLLRPATLAAMRAEQFAGSRYGYGWALYDKPGGSAGGHAGGLPGAATWLLRSADGRMHCAAFFNSRPSDEDTFFDEAYHVLLSGRPLAAPAGVDLAANTLDWEAWRQRHFGDVPAGAEEDPDHDGLPNLIEYAAGLDPARIDATTPSTWTVREDGVPIFTFRRLLLGHPLTWTVEMSQDGHSWSPAETAGAQTTLNPDGTLAVSRALPDAVQVRLRVRHVISDQEQIFQPSLAPQMIVVSIGETITLHAPPAADNTTYRWRRNGTVLPGVSGTRVTLTSVSSADAGLYTVEREHTSDSVCLVATVAIRSAEKVAGAAELVGSDIRHPNGNVYDQMLLTGDAATISADPGQVTRISFIDLTNDIVQVEFSGAGSMTVALANAAGPALPASYNQDLRYMKGHATIVVADADGTTNVSVFSVGRANAVNAALFKPEVAYDGVADLATLAIHSRVGRFAGIYLGNAHLFASHGVTGIRAAEVRVTGPVRLGDVSAFDEAMPRLEFGSLDEVRITGGDLEQPNHQPLQVLGISRMQLAAGGKSDGTLLPAQSNRARITCHGADVTPWMVGP